MAEARLGYAFRDPALLDAALTTAVPASATTSGSSSSATLF